MRHIKKLVSLLSIAAAMPIVFSTGCEVHAGYYDPYYQDRHRWVVDEPYYGRWERETHRQHEEFRRRRREERREYWEWRHHH